MSLIEIRHVSKWFGPKCAVSDLSFQLDSSEVLAFIGPNGAGKSTTMRMITGFLPISEGSIWVDGMNVEKNLLEIKKRIGYLPENAPLYPNRTIYEFLDLCAELRGFRSLEKKQRIERVMTQCQLDHVKNQLIDTLSKGYRHRTCLAQSLLHDPSILILDEPTDGLDPNQKNEIRNLIRQLGKERAIIVSTHILEEAESIATRLFLINNGQSVYDGTLADLKIKYPPNRPFFELLLQHEKNLQPEVLLPNLIQKAQVVRLNRLSSETISCLNIIPETNEGLETKVDEVIQICRQQNWHVLRISLNDRRLEDIFAQLTKGHSE